MGENGVTISFKEIYEEQKKTSQQISNLALRMDRLESKLEKQDQRQAEFSQKVKTTLLSTLIPIVLAVFWFVAKGGGL